ncbi:MAG: hypothetical protein LBM27_00175 [Lactobacillaceae bacterium]|jgi:hypothetical protein|nr:hypothetical protein [Lactobacillaceae bacterium]
MTTKIIVSLLPAMAVLISLIGLFGNYWQNFFANRLKIVEKTDEIINRFKENVIRPFNVLINQINLERIEEFNILNDKKNELDDQDYSLVTKSIVQLHRDEILLVIKELNQLSLLLRTRYVSTSSFLEFTVDDIKSFILFLSENSKQDLSKLSDFLCESKNILHVFSRNIGEWINDIRYY